MAGTADRAVRLSDRAPVRDRDAIDRVPAVTSRADVGRAASASSGDHDAGPPASLADLDLDAAIATPGTWLELAVEVDPEAVEAVSEILARGAPGGTSVEPAFLLVDEGLAARLDPSRPAVVRAHFPLGAVGATGVAGTAPGAGAAASGGVGISGAMDATGSAPGTEGTPATGSARGTAGTPATTTAPGTTRAPATAAAPGTTRAPATATAPDTAGTPATATAPGTTRAPAPRKTPVAAPPGPRDDLITAVGRVERELGHLQAFGLRPIGELHARIVREADWADAWKRHFPVLRVGRRLVIRPTWRRHRRAEGDVVLALDPGMAFGTGLHPTTRLCLAALERLADEGVLATGGARGTAARVLDVGSGSGILSIASVRLGSGPVLAVDVDPIAVSATLANAKRNRVARLVRARKGSVPTDAGPFDVVLANLVASLLVRLADGLVADLRPGGTLVASGIFVDRESEVGDAFRARGLRVTGRTTEGDWVAIRARRA
jgi:ribosomal protein L11 methyltransferase